MPPHRYLRGFTLCVPLPDDGESGLVEGVILKCLSIRAEASLADSRAYDLVVRVDIRLGDPREMEGGDSFPTEVYVFPFPATRAERRARIRDIIARLLPLSAVESPAEHPP